MKKAIITGATGFIGRWLIRELIKQNVNIIAVIRKNSPNRSVLKDYSIKIVECDLDQIQTLPSLIDDRDIDAVFHIAWQGVSDADARNFDIQIQNLQATINLIEIMHQMSIPTFVGAGSLHEIEGAIEMQEDKIISNTAYMYKASKLAAHWMGKALAGKYGIRFFWPLINTYGEEENSARLVNTTIKKIFAGQVPALSAGNQIYDFVHVSDVAHALYLIAEYGVDGTNYAIGSGEAKPLREFLMIVGKIANEVKGGKEVPLGLGEIVNNVVSLPKETFDISDLFRDTGFVPQITFEEGVKRTAHWIHDNAE